MALSEKSSFYEITGLNNICAIASSVNKVTLQLSFLQKKGKCSSSLEQEPYNVSCGKHGLKTGEKLNSQLGITAALVVLWRREERVFFT